MKLMKSYATEVYVSNAGYLAITQVGDYGDEDVMILLSKEQARAVQAEIAELLKIEDWPNGGAFKKDEDDEGEA